MHVVSVIGLKGGSTKSTLTAHLAVAAQIACFVKPWPKRTPSRSLGQVGSGTCGWGVLDKGVERGRDHDEAALVIETLGLSMRRVRMSFAPSKMPDRL